MPLLRWQPRFVRLLNSSPSWRDKRGGIAPQETLALARSVFEAARGHAGSLGLAAKLQAYQTKLKDPTIWNDPREAAVAQKEASRLELDLRRVQGLAERVSQSEALLGKEHGRTKNFAVHATNKQTPSHSDPCCISLF